MIPRLKPRLGLRELLAAFLPPRRGEVARFESDFAAHMGQRHAVAFPYGRTGLALLLEALGVKGKEVICPAYTCVVVPHAVVASGNEPVFVDSRPDDFNMDLGLAERAIGPATAALVATSLFGYPVDLDRLGDLRRRHPHVAVIQDCAHSFNAEWHGRPVQRAGDAAVFGCNISKLMTSVFGGVVTTDSDALADSLRRVRDAKVRRPPWTKGLRRRLYLASVYPAFAGPVYGFVNWLERSGLLDRFTRYYDEGRIDMPADYLRGLTAVEARVGRSQLRRLGAVIAHRRRVAALYDEALRGTPGLRLPPPVPGATYSHYVARCRDREGLIAALLPRGVQLGRLIEYCIPDMPAYRERPGALQDCPAAREMARTAVNLPLHVGEREALAVAGHVRAALAVRRAA